MQRILAFGDIHGCADVIKQLIEKVNPTEEDILIFLGDYIDRGSMSFEVIEFLIELNKNFKCIFLKGNHEDMMIRCLKNRDREMCRIFTYNGGDDTMKSYKKSLNLDSPMKWDDLPKDHQEFYDNLLTSYQLDDFFFVHAGVDPNYPLDKQYDGDLLWIRNNFLFHEGQVAGGLTVVHGHTPMIDDEIDKYNNKYEDKINLDSGCVFGYILTCMDVLTGTKYTVKNEGKGWKNF